jgi:5-formyltetrahydrofolate cyclo-ligase
VTTAEGDDRAAARRRLRTIRRSLPATERAAAAAGVAANLARLGLPTAGSRVAVYLPMDGELDPAPAVSLVRGRGCQVYAPAVTSFRARRMCFRLLRPEAGLRRNRWGIRQPAGICTSGRWLDLVLVPCVAFDSEGVRLGMGAGFYDRHFAFLRQRRAWRRPRLLGLAYDWQRLPSIDARYWDVPLWGIVTDRRVYGHAARHLRPAVREIPE